jgi:hypothetical protein
MPLNFSQPRLTGKTKNDAWVIFSALAWGIMVLAGFLLVWKYENTPTFDALRAAKQWPAESGLALAPEPRHTLVMLAHPKCPCTRASIGELELLMTQTQKKLSAYVLFMKPEGEAEDWTRTDLWHKARAIPDVQVIMDEGGKKARHFKAETSGQVYLYDPSGKLQFAGGITISRGHSGSNPGRSAIVSYIHEGKIKVKQTASFGCPLFSDSLRKAEAKA